MTQAILIGIGAGLAAALLFVSPLSGTSLAFPLFALTGLPIGIAGLGWTAFAGLVAAGTGAVILSLAVSVPGAGLFLLLFGLPVVCLARLAGLSRDVESGREWYPAGRILLHLAGTVTIGIVIVGIMAGYDVNAMTAVMTDALMRWFQAQPELGTPPVQAELEPFVRLNVAILPYTLAAIGVVVLAFQFWLAATVTRASGRLDRPTEPLWFISLPQIAGPAFLIAAIGSLLPGSLGSILAVAAGALGCAFALIGLALVHFATVGNALRPLVLIVVYGLIIIAGFPMLILALLGLAETYLQLRARRSSGGPPTSN